MPKPNKYVHKFYTGAPTPSVKGYSYYSEPKKKQKKDPVHDVDWPTIFNPYHNSSLSDDFDNLSKELESVTPGSLKSWASQQAVYVAKPPKEVKPMKYLRVIGGPLDGQVAGVQWPVDHNTVYPMNYTLGDIRAIHHDAVYTVDDAVPVLVYSLLTRQQVAALLLDSYPTKDEVPDHVSILYQNGVYMALPVENGCYELNDFLLEKIVASKQPGVVYLTSPYNGKMQSADLLKSHTYAISEAALKGLMEGATSPQLIADNPPSAHINIGGITVGSVPGVYGSSGTPMYDVSLDTLMAWKTTLGDHPLYASITTPPGVAVDFGGKLFGADYKPSKSTPNVAVYQVNHVGVTTFKNDNQYQPLKGLSFSFEGHTLVLKHKQDQHYELGNNSLKVLEELVAPKLPQSVVTEYMGMKLVLNLDPLKKKYEFSKWSVDSLNSYLVAQNIKKMLDPPGNSVLFMADGQKFDIKYDPEMGVYQMGAEDQQQLVSMPMSVELEVGNVKTTVYTMADQPSATYKMSLLEFQKMQSSINPGNKFLIETPDKIEVQFGGAKVNAYCVYTDYAQSKFVYAVQTDDLMALNPQSPPEMVTAQDKDVFPLPPKITVDNGLEVVSAELVYSQGVPQYHTIPQLSAKTVNIKFGELTVTGHPQGPHGGVSTYSVTGSEKTWLTYKLFDQYAENQKLALVRLFLKEKHPDLQKVLNTAKEWEQHLEQTQKDGLADEDQVSISASLLKKFLGVCTTIGTA